VICSSTEPLADRMKAITGGAGAGSVLDCVGGDLAEQLAAAVRSGGTVWLYGLMEGLSFKGHGAECLFRLVISAC
jgi:NADPH:quinone reductase-like Zn-dependent oxidoreductase